MLNRFNLCIFITFLICCIHQNAHAVLRSPAEWATQVLKQSNRLPPDSDEEPGFDLNEEDMLKFHIWPSGIIPYFIDDFSFDKVLRDRIRLYLDNINKVTGLRFVEIPRPPEDDRSRWVLFINRKGQLGCADHPFHNFTNEGVQRVVLGYDCLTAGELNEVVLSLVGVPPQHNSPDREKSIQVLRENILPDKLYLFEILKDDEWLFHDLYYDFDSAGHYGPYRYTSNGAETFVVQPHSRQEQYKIDSSLKGLSKDDLKKIHMLYNYILKHKNTPINIPGCHKLFAPGPDFSNFQRNDSIKVEPRKKPNKYLLLPNEMNQVQTDDNSDKKDNLDINKSDNESFEKKKDDIFNSTNINGSRENDYNQDDRNQISRQKNISLLSHKLNKKDKILNESDYETGDERN